MLRYLPVLAFSFSLFVLNCHPSGPATGGDSSNKLRRLIGEHRLTRARLYGFPHRAYDPERIVPLNLKLYRQIDNATRGIQRGADPELMLLNAFGQLVNGDRRIGLQQAIRTLEAQEPTAETLNELAAYRFELATNTQLDKRREAELFLAEKEIGQALKLNPNLIEAKYNQALIFDALYLPDDAAQAWADYLAVETDEAWRAEAEAIIAQRQDPQDVFTTQVAALTQAMASEDIAAIRRIVIDHGALVYRLMEKKFLPAWADDQMSLTGIELVADMLVDINGDHFFKNLITEIKTQPFQADAHKYALKLYHDVDDDDQVDNPEAFQKPELWRQTSFTFNHRLEFERIWLNSGTKLSDFQKLYSAIQGKNYVKLEAETQWSLAVTSSGANDTGIAAEAYQAIGDLLDGTSYHVLFAGAQVQIGLHNAFIGERRKAATAFSKAAARMQKEQRPRRRFQFYVNAAYLARLFNNLDLALRYLKYAEPIALDPIFESNYPGSQAAVIMHQAGCLIDLNRLNDARVLEAHMFDIIQNMEQVEDRQLMQANHLALKGRLTTDTREAVLLAGQALDVLPESKAIHVPRLRVNLARARYLDGDGQGALNDLNTVIAVFESNREGLVDPATQSAFLNARDTIFDTAVEIALAADQPQLALEYHEQRRARVLFDQVGKKNTRPSIPEIQAQLPADTTLAIYAQLDTGFHLWSLTRDQLQVFQLDENLDSADIDRLISRMQQGEIRDQLEPDLNRFHRLLIQPLDLAPGSRLVIVPDGPLHRLPFSVLAPPNQPYLIEQHTLTRASSAAVFTACRARLAELDVKTINALVIGVPQATEPNLDFLPSVAQEVALISQRYGVQPLMDADATEAAFLKAAPTSNIIHFAGHAVVNTEEAERSRLLLTPDDQDDGRLTIQELAQHALPNTRCVYLSACSTSAGPAQGREGVASFSRAFLQLNVPTVIGSLWNIQDQASAILAARFHEQLSNHQTTSEALTAAQRSLIQEGEPPGNWAFMVHIGGI